MDSQCDLCRMKKAGYRLSTSLPYLNDYICEECLAPPTCSACNSSLLKIEGDFSGSKTCLDCGYCIIWEAPEVPLEMRKKNRKSGYTEESLKWIEDNTIYFIEIVPEEILENIKNGTHRGTW